jgi:hypothetical protein
VNISYLDFWPGFDPDNNWFNLAFREALGADQVLIISPPEMADVILFSGFGDQHKNCGNSKAVKVFYTGENQRPDFPIADYSLTFDFETHHGRNFRLPLWWVYINWWDEPDFPHARISKQRLFHSYTPTEVIARKEFCSIIIGNPVRNRIEVAQKLHDFKPVHGYGNVFGNPYHGCKIDLMSKYRYNICFENTLQPGYVTEKLLEAKVAGCIPIYYGSDSAKIDFNSKCYLNLIDYKDADELILHIVELERNPRKFQQIASEPLFSVKPDLENLYHFIRRILQPKISGITGGLSK